MIQVRCEPGSVRLPATVLWCLPVFESEFTHYIIQWGIEMCGISWPDMSDVFIDYFLLAEQLCALGVEGQPQVSPVLHPVGLIWGVRIGEALAFWSTPPHWLSSEGAISPLSAIWGYFRSAHLADWQPHISCSVYNDSRVLLSHLSENS